MPVWNVAKDAAGRELLLGLGHKRLGTDAHGGLKIASLQRVFEMHHRLRIGPHAGIEHGKLILRARRTRRKKDGAFQRAHRRFGVIGIACCLGKTQCGCQIAWPLNRLAEQGIARGIAGLRQCRGSAKHGGKAQCCAASSLLNPQPSRLNDTGLPHDAPHVPAQE